MDKVLVPATDWQTWWLSYLYVTMSSTLFDPVPCARCETLCSVVWIYLVVLGDAYYLIFAADFVAYMC